MSKTATLVAVLSLYLRPFGLPPNVVAVTRFARSLVQLSGRHAKLQERYCNEGCLSKADYRRRASIELRIREALAPYGVAVKFTGDPRGYTVQLLLPGDNPPHNTVIGASGGWGI